MPAEFAPIWLRPERGQRGRRPSLSRDEITRAAIELADSEGLSAVSMRRIGTKLGAGTTSLYWYVSSKEDLYELMFDACIGAIELPEQASGEWRKDLTALAWSTHHMIRAHPWVPMLGIQPGLGPNTRRYGVFAMSALQGLGLTMPVMTNILAALNNYLIGFGTRNGAWDELRRQSGLTVAEWDAQLHRYADRSADISAEVSALIRARLELTSDASFEFGLTCVLDGIAAQIARHKAT